MLKFFIPAFIGVFVNAMYNIVDRIFIGQGVGSMALSGVSATFPIMLIVMGFGMLIGIGAGVLVSINMGRRDMDKAERVLGNSFLLMLLVSVTHYHRRFCHQRTDAAVVWCNRRNHWLCQRLPGYYPGRNCFFRWSAFHSTMSSELKGMPGSPCIP